MENVSAAFLRELRKEGVTSCAEGPREVTRVPPAPAGLKENRSHPAWSHRLSEHRPLRAGRPSKFFLAPKLML